MELQLIDENYQDELYKKDKKIHKDEKLRKLKSCSVEIKINGKKGTGFLCLLKDDNDSKIPVLITNNNVIDLDHLVKGKKIKIYIDDFKVEKEIIIKEDTKRFTNKCLDITMIEINKNLSNEFLEYNDEEIIEEDNIYILQNQNGEKAFISNGVIKSIEKFNIKYNCKTEDGTSGFAILNSFNSKVLGVQKSCEKNNNVGTLIKYANERFLKTIKKKLIYDFMNVKNKNPDVIYYKRIQLSNGDEYEGELIGNNIREGYGYCKSVDNYIYKGEYKNDKRNGYGILFKKNDKDKKIIYEGYWKDNKYHGKGEKFLKNGKVYIGEWENGKPKNCKIINNDENSKVKKTKKINFKFIISIISFIVIIVIVKMFLGGIYFEVSKNEKIEYGELNYPEGKYIGQIKNGKMDGEGVFIWSNGKKKYEGEFKNDKIEGQGMMIYSSGDKYKGEFKNGVRKGYKIDKIFTKDYIYEGEIKNDKKEGHGIYTLGGKIIYEGEWKNNKFDGYGEYTYSSGKKYKGEFKNEKREGYGIFTSTNGKIEYEGEWKNDDINGNGEYTYPNGDKYKGSFNNKKREGYGVLTLANGKIEYQGQWKNNMINGFGEYNYLNGDKYKGEFKNRKRDGYGVLTLANGIVIYEGEWKNDKRVEIE